MASYLACNLPVPETATVVYNSHSRHINGNRAYCEQIKLLLGGCVALVRIEQVDCLIQNTTADHASFDETLSDMGNPADSGV
jgi:hypothetical protein